MKKSSASISNALTGSSLIILFILIFFSFKINAQVTGKNFVENKVDYLERIYFSGENKEGLNTKILIALQELQGKSPTTALAKQVTFLVDIKDEASAAHDACDILDMLAVGIYNIDAAEAASQGVHLPSDNAKAKSFNALASLDKLTSATSNLSSGVNNLAWSSYLLSGSKYGSFSSGATKFAGNFGNVAGAVGQAGQTAKVLVGVGKSLGISFKKKDKPCKEVMKKDIPIGEHPDLAVNPNSNTNTNAATSTTRITIQGVSSTFLSSLASALKTKAGVQSVEKSYNKTLSTITISHSGSADALVYWLEGKFSTKLKLIDFVTDKINFTAKIK